MALLITAFSSFILFYKPFSIILLVIIIAAGVFGSYMHLFDRRRQV